MPRTDARRSLGSSAWRFLVAGGANTAITALALAGLSLVIDPRLAYTLVFAGGVVLSTYLADRYVFGVAMSRAAVAAYIAMYVVVYGIGLLVVDRIGTLGLPDWASSAVVVVTAPLTFVGGRIITGAVHRRRTSTIPQEDL
ncbi:GtrA family protein [Sanguibacter massiliensis]|uniref:GtrA family protein n=1 Tax=Sanguibacter massiliensis TaxID=1973217 RepID=UPI000C8422C3|nr:GtrA family protein [Sanguibacter massiliensis]